MIRLTERAIEAIGKLSEERAEPGQQLRVSIKSGGCSGLEYAMEFAFPEASDEPFEQGGLSYLVDRKSLKRLEGCEIDFDDGLTGKGFEIRNPNAASTCGCGKSFN
jgi:iron-sulfur cluster assembly protein/iron-sulfur cluster insertion protein